MPYINEKTEISCVRPLPWLHCLLRANSFCPCHLVEPAWLPVWMSHLDQGAFLSNLQLMTVDDVCIFLDGSSFIRSQKVWEHPKFFRLCHGVQPGGLRLFAAVTGCLFYYLVWWVCLLGDFVLLSEFREFNLTFGMWFVVGDLFFSEIFGMYSVIYLVVTSIIIGDSCWVGKLLMSWRGWFTWWEWKCSDRPTGSRSLRHTKW